MSTNGTPYWPGDANSLYFQNLAYNSTTNVLSLTPFGNSVALDSSSLNPSFSTITVSSIGANVSFTGNVTIPNGVINVSTIGGTSGGGFLYVDNSLTVPNKFVSENSASFKNLDVSGGGITQQGYPLIQYGYADEVPFVSTILFTDPYADDNVFVSLTPTNKNVSGGANPNISLVASWGNNGVSSIGFQADTRNGGVGYNGSFWWNATWKPQ